MKRISLVFVSFAALFWVNKRNQIHHWAQPVKDLDANGVFKLVVTMRRRQGVFVEKQRSVQVAYFLLQIKINRIKRKFA